MYYCQEHGSGVPIEAHAFLFVPWTAMGTSSADKMSLPSTSIVCNVSTRGTGWSRRQKYLQGVPLIGTDDPIRRGTVLADVLDKVVTLFVILFYDRLQGFKV